MYSPSAFPPLDNLASEADTLAFLDGLDVSAMKLGLDRVRKLLQSLNNPQDALAMVHIAGTNGKGSVTAMLSAILQAAGLRVGRFTSPHLIQVRERIVLNGNPILQDDFQYEVGALKRHLETANWPREDWPTYFEFLTVAAYQYFKRKAVDVTVMETGLGGRLDATNAVKSPQLTVITSIGMDHTQHLGDTLARIAAEKAGILKPGCPLVLGGPLPGEAEAVILQQAEALACPVSQAQADDYSVAPDSNPRNGLCLRNLTTGQRYRTSLLGPYQKANIATVLACVQQLRLQGYAISEEAVLHGLAHTDWPVRFQYFPEQNLLLDGSHNADGFASLSEGLAFYFPHRPKAWLVSLRANRDPALLLAMLLQESLPVAVVVTQAQPAHLYHSPAELANTLQAGLQNACPVWVTDTPAAGLQQLLNSQRDTGTKTPLGVVTGSLYTAGAVLQSLNRA